MIQVVGHRGAPGLAPENTLAGFRRAIELGVDGVECDVHLTADGRVVVMHDPTVDRTTDGAGEISRMSLADIRRLDAGQGERVPTLEELLDAIRGRCGLLCEIKADAAAGPAAELVAHHRMEQDVLFMSFQLDHLRAIRGKGTRYRLAAVLSSDDLPPIQRAEPLGIEAALVNYRNCRSRTSLEYLHRQALTLGVFTPNTLEDMQAMIEHGVDRIITDRPEILVEHLRRPRPA